MANKRPLVINTATNQIEEIGTSDTLTCDGGGLTGITGTGSGVNVQDSGTARGTPGTLNFGTGLTVAAPVGGVSLIESSFDIVSDTTPQLGGNLDTNSKNIVLGDSSGASVNRLTLGAAPDMSLYHDGTSGSIDLTNGSLTVRVHNSNGKGFYIEDPNGTATIAKFEKDATSGKGRCELMFDGAKTFETVDGGVDITGTLEVTGVLTAGGLTYPNTNGTSGQQLTSDGAGNVTWAAAGSGGGGGTSLGSRTTKAGTTGTLAAAASADLNITGAFKSYALLKVAIDHPAWVVLYTNDTTRTADDARVEGTDPTPGSGVLVEVLTTTAGASTFVMTPGLIGWNDDGTPATTIYAKVKNKDTSARAITVTLTVIQLEA